METYLIDVPIPSMGATVNELTVIDIMWLKVIALPKAIRSLNWRAISPFSNMRLPAMEC